MKNMNGEKLSGLIEAAQVLNEFREQAYLDGFEDAIQIVKRVKEEHNADKSPKDGSQPEWNDGYAAGEKRLFEELLRRLFEKRGPGPMLQ